MPETVPASAASPPRDWTAIRWNEIPPAAAARFIAVLPLAATEQHGPHLPLETDTLIAEAFLARVRAVLPAEIPASFMPVQPVGVSTEHLDFPGTQTLSVEAALTSWIDLGAGAARAGVKKLVMVTSHGGNSAVMTLVAQHLRARHGMLAVATGWHRFGQPAGLFSEAEIRHGVHGGAIETAIMLAAWPARVRHERIANFHPSSLEFEAQFRWLSTQRPAPFAWQAQDLNPRGAVGDATQATADKGSRLIDHGARAFCELLADVHAFDLAALSHRPEPAGL